MKGLTVINHLLDCHSDDARRDNSVHLALRLAGRTKVRSKKLSCLFSRTPDQLIRNQGSRRVSPCEPETLILNHSIDGFGFARNQRRQANQPHPSSWATGAYLEWRIVLNFGSYVKGLTAINLLMDPHSDDARRDNSVHPALRPAGRTKVRSNRLSCLFRRTPDFLTYWGSKPRKKETFDNSELW